MSTTAMSESGHGTRRRTGRRRADARSAGGAPLLVAVVLLAIPAGPAAAQLLAAGSQFIFQDALGGAIEAGDGFGAVLAAGDFDGDGISDLAIGAPSEDIGAAVDAGAVFVVYGSVSGLGMGPLPPLVLHQNVGSIDSVAQTNERFGAALVAGNFNGDAFDELAVGAPADAVEVGPGVFVPEAGSVHVFNGSAGGLSTSGSYITGESFSPATWNAGAGDELGAALGAGDTQGAGGRDELLIGVPGAPSTSPLEDDAGGVLVVPGSASGPDPSTGFAFVPPREAGDRVGAAIAVGDVDDGGVADEIFSAPFADLEGALPSGAGVVRAVLSTGFEVLEGAAENDRFGTALAVGDFKGGGYPQLLIGVPGRPTEGADESGLVFIYDLVAGFPGLGIVWQGLGSYQETPDPFDHFGEVLAAGDFNDDGYDDAVFGVPGENLFDGFPNAVLDAGIVQVAYGSPVGLSEINNQMWTLATTSLEAFDNDRYGAAVAAGDFDGDGVDDLAIGASGALVMGQAGTGLVHILYGRSHALLFEDGFESGNTSAWSAP